MNKSLPSPLLTLVAQLNIVDVAKPQLLAALYSLPDSPPPNGVTIAETIQLQRDAAGDIVKGSSKRIGNVRFHLGDFLLSAIKTGFEGLITQEEVIPSILAMLTFLQDVVKHLTIDLTAEDAHIIYTIWKMLEVGTIPTIPGLAVALGPDTSELKLAARLQYLVNIGCVKMAAGEIGLNDRIVIRSD